MRNDDRERPRGGCEGLTGEALERHLFVCEHCRGDVRLSAAWEALRGDRAETSPAPASEAFVSRVLRARRREIVRERRRRFLLAAAAVLLFFFAAGANSQRATPPPNTDDVYASLANSSSVLEGFLPD